jgi:hypothetical protein
LDELLNTVDIIGEDESGSEFLISQLSDNLIFSFTVKAVGKRFENEDGLAVDIN